MAKKVSFNVVNAALVIVLVGFLLFHYIVEHDNSGIINEYDTEILKQKVVITNLEMDNKVIDNSITMLVDSVISLKAEAIQYEDSLLKIQDDYEEVIKEVSVLSDSLSVVHFRMHTSKHSDRLGIDLDR